MSEDGENDDALKDSYDLVLYGTGLVESIVACAASRAGKSVLHLDKYNYYGRECTGSSLEQFLSRAQDNFDGKYDLDVEESSNSMDPAPNDCVELAFDPISSRQSYERVVDMQGIVVDAKDRSAAEPGRAQRTQCHPSTWSYVMEKEARSSVGSPSSNSSHTCHPCFFDYVKDHGMTKLRAMLKSRFFSVDSSCRLLLGSAASIDTMIASGVSKYLEFKSVEGLFYVESGAGVEIHSVPCSKGDIFTSKLLNAFEKRALMKFLQSAIDWGQKQEGNLATTLNERELAAGRALKRPQNKRDHGGAVEKSKDPSSHDDGFSPSLLEFRDYLTSQKISTRLQDIIVYALCFHGEKLHTATTLATTSLKTSDAFKFICEHINALGKFGDTAFLAPMYGSAELPQSFCRMSAVWGGVYVLRRFVSSLLYTSKLAGDGSGASVGGDEEIAVHAIRDSTGRVIKCGSFVCNVEDWPLKKSVFTALSFVVTRICVVDAPLLPLGRSIAILPPETAGIGNAQAVFVVQQDSSSAVAPDGAYVIHISTRVTWTCHCPSAEQQHSPGFDTWQFFLNSDDFQSQSSKLLNDVCAFFHTKAAFSELCHVTSVRPMREVENAGVTLSDGKSISNVAICGDARHAIHSNHAFEQAKEIFQRLFPNDEFLPVATECDERANSGGREVEIDEDELELDSALEAVVAAGIEEAGGEVLQQHEN